MRKVYILAPFIALAAGVVHVLLDGYSYDPNFPDEILWSSLGHAVPMWGLCLLGTLKTKRKFLGWLVVFCILELLYSVGAYDLLSEERAQSSASTSTDSIEQVEVKRISEPEQTKRGSHAVGSGDFFRYSIGSDVYRFDIPEGYGDATLAYKQMSEDPRLMFTLVCNLVPKENLREVFGGREITHPEFLKIDILNASKDRKISLEEFKEALNYVNQSLPEITRRDHFLMRNGFEIANDQIKRVRGDDSGFEVVSTTNLGIVHKDDLSLLWTQVMPFDLKLNGEIRRIGLVATLGIFYLDGRAFYFTLAKEFKEGLNFEDFESQAVSYVKQNMKQK